MFGFLPIWHALQMLRWLTFRILQAFRTSKDNLTSVLCITNWPLFTNISHTPIRCMYPFVQKWGFPPLVLTSQTFIQVVLLPIRLYLTCASLWLTS